MKYEGEGKGALGRQFDPHQKKALSKSKALLGLKG